MAIKSSNLSGITFIIVSFIPWPSNWKTPVVIPFFSILNVLLSSNGILSISISTFFFFNILHVSFITVRVFRPKKSNFINPTFSTYFIEYCVTGISDFGSLYNGTISLSFLSEITIPAACVEACRSNPSNLLAWLNNFFISGLFFMIFFIWLFSLKNSSKVTGFAGLNGIILQISSINDKGSCITLPTSLMAAFAWNDPNVIICATLSNPYFCWT